ncbi:hypothetical protein CDL12_14995 [Handroanthus impetiginosus]|uniref:Uncharacterized protein n=1 Tax=Handroanthus impetiginosus TaxID=429701 RepID=A0A2G9H503_9LAMI|nr:hypothetical protein CDL12_14995 [Handroanthus impetiginosus]
MNNLLHSKRKNRLAQKKLNDLVYIKYNRALRRRYDMRDTIDPIALTEIDENIEWMVGVMENEEDVPVFEGEDLTWGDVGDAMGVDEPAYNYRSTFKFTSIEGSKAPTSSKGKRKAIVPSSSRSRRLIDDVEEEEVEENFDDSDEEMEELDNECYKSESNDETENEDDGDDLDDDSDF